MESVQALNGKGSRTTRSWASILNRSSSLTKVSEYAFVHRTCNNPVLFSRSLKKSISTMMMISPCSLGMFRQPLSVAVAVWEISTNSQCRSFRISISAAAISLYNTIMLMRAAQTGSFVRRYAYSENLIFYFTEHRICLSGTGTRDPVHSYDTRNVRIAQRWIFYRLFS